jgi:hypothetical protein
MFVFFSYNAAAADACIAVMRRQCWPLQDRQIMLSIFSDMVPNEMKKKCVTALSAIPREPVEPGKPDFPHLVPGMELCDFVGPQSWVPFDLIGRGTDWMSLDPESWPLDPEYVATKVVVEGLYGVNDPAERGCHMAQRFKVIFVLFYVIKFNSKYLRITEFSKEVENRILCLFYHPNFLSENVDSVVREISKEFVYLQMKMKSQTSQHCYWDANHYLQLLDHVIRITIYLVQDHGPRDPTQREAMFHAISEDQDKFPDCCKSTLLPS